MIEEGEDHVQARAEYHKQVKLLNSSLEGNQLIMDGG